MYCMYNQPLKRTKIRLLTIWTWLCTLQAVLLASDPCILWARSHGVSLRPRPPQGVSWMHPHGVSGRRPECGRVAEASSGRVFKDSAQVHPQDVSLRRWARLLLVQEKEAGKWGCDEVLWGGCLCDGVRWGGFLWRGSQGRYPCMAHCVW